MAYSVVVIYEGYEPEIVEAGLSKQDAESEARFLNFDSDTAFYYIEKEDLWQ